MSKFVVWIDAPTDNNTITYEELEQVKVNGFIPNNVISSSEVNSIIRQSNLVACALMNLTGDNTLDYRSSVQDVQNVLGSHFATSINNFTMATTRSNIEPSDTLLIQLGKISKYFNDLGSLAYKSEVDTTDFKSTAVSPNAKNVTTTINGKKISDIFDSDGITVKKAKVANSCDKLSSTIQDYNRVLTNENGSVTGLRLPNGVYHVWVTSKYFDFSQRSDTMYNFGLMVVFFKVGSGNCTSYLPDCYDYITDTTWSLSYDPYDNGGYFYLSKKVKGESEFNPANEMAIFYKQIDTTFNSNNIVS